MWSQSNSSVVLHLEDISEISSTSTIFTMSAFQPKSQNDVIDELTQEIEHLKVGASKTTTEYNGISVATDTLKVHQLLTKHQMLYGSKATPPGKWAWGGLREIRSKANADTNPNLVLPDGVATFYGNLDYEYKVDTGPIKHDVISMSPVIVDLKTRAPSKSKNSGTYGVDWWNIYIPIKLMEKLAADIKRVTGYIVGNDGVIMDNTQGLASITVNIRNAEDSPEITMVTPKVNEEDGAADGVDHENMGTMAEIMASGGEDELLAGVGFFSLGVSIKGNAGQEPPPAGSLVKLSLKMKAFHALSVIEDGVRRITYNSNSKGLKYS